MRLQLGEVLVGEPWVLQPRQREPAGVELGLGAVRALVDSRCRPRRDRRRASRRPSAPSITSCLRSFHMRDCAVRVGDGGRQVRDQRQRAGVVAALLRPQRLARRRGPDALRSEAGSAPIRLSARRAVAHRHPRLRQHLLVGRQQAASWRARLALRRRRAACLRGRRSRRRSASSRSGSASAAASAASNGWVRQMWRITSAPSPAGRWPDRPRPAPSRPARWCGSAPANQSITACGPKPAAFDHLLGRRLRDSPRPASRRGRAGRRRARRSSCRRDWSRPAPRARSCAPADRKAGSSPRGCGAQSPRLAASRASPSIRESESLSGCVRSNTEASGRRRSRDRWPAPPVPAATPPRRGRIAALDQRPTQMRISMPRGLRAHLKRTRGARLQAPRLADILS